MLASLCLNENLKKQKNDDIELKIERILTNRSLEFGYVIRKFDLNNFTKNHDIFKKNLQSVLHMTLVKNNPFKKPKKKQKDIKTKKKKVIYNI